MGGEAAAGGEYNDGELEEGYGEEGELTPEQQSDIERAWRRRSLKVHNALRASTGLLRLSEAGSGSAGTFRLSFIGSYFSASEFLCNTDTDPETGHACISSDGTVSADEVSRMGADVGLSATLTSFLEAYLGVHTQATSDDRGDPQLLQVLGDTNLGLKLFLPKPPEQIFSVGGELELWLLNGTGGVGLDTSGTSFAIRALASLDLSNRIKEEDQVPFKAHVNLGYMFDNSGALVEKTEDDRGGWPISRIERFGLGISRVDKFQIGLGAEGPFGVIHPFLEWSIDIPMQRQDYVCNLSRSYPGDACLAVAHEFGRVPSRLGLGARLFPGLDGLSLLAAFEIATGGSSSFIEEVTPEAPWNLYFGLGYAADTVPPTPIVERVPAEEEAPPPPPPPPPRRYISGSVLEAGSGEVVAGAIVRYQTGAYTGMVTGQDGTFRTGDLPPGTYTFAVTADGYRDGECSAIVPIELPAVPMPGGEPAPGAVEQPGQPGAAPAAAPAQPGVPAAQPGGDPYYPPRYLTVAGLMAAQAGVQPGVPAPPPPAAAPPPPPPAAPAADAAAGPAPAAPLGQPAPTDAGVAPGSPQEIVIPLRCELEALPKVGNVLGSTVDAESGSPVGGAKVRITDRLGRFLELTTDASGSFRFENVPPGLVKLRVEAAGFLPSVTEIEVEPRKDIRASLSVNRIPARPNVVVTNRELKLKKQVHFQHNSAEILPDSMAILQEAADVLLKRTDIEQVEIQGHTDNTGTPPYNLRLSQERAEAVVNALVELGVDESRLTAKGYGQERPLAPNTSDANRARNRRVQMIIKKRGR